MITIMRKHHKVLMIFITGLVCISFSWYWNKTDFAQMGNGVVGKIYDRNVSQVEFQRNSRLLRLGSRPRDARLSRNSHVGAQTENEAYENFSWNLMVLRHEADELGIKPTTTEIAAVVKTLPAFQGKEGFDLAKYTDFADHALAPMGFSEAQIEELAGGSDRYGRVQKLLGAGVSMAESQMRADFAAGLLEDGRKRGAISVGRFCQGRADNRSTDITKYYEAHKAELKTDEERQVKFVSFRACSDEQKKLTGKARIDVLQKLAETANDFTDALQAKGADFDAVVEKFHLNAEGDRRVYAGQTGSAARGRTRACAGGFRPNERSAERRCHPGAGRLLHRAPRQDRSGPSAHAGGSATKDRRDHKAGPGAIAAIAVESCGGCQRNSRGDQRAANRLQKPRRRRV